MRTRHCQQLVLPEESIEEISPLEHGNPSLTGSDDFRIIVGDGGRTDDDIRTGNIGSRMSFVQCNA